MKFAALLALAASPAVLAETRVERLAVTDLSGHGQSIETQGRITAVLFISTRCPVSNDYLERLKTLHADYNSRVQFVFVNANFNEPPAEVEQHSRDSGFTFPVWKDNDAVLANRFQASSTPEAIVLDQTGAVRYQGAIDNARNPARVTKMPLRDALEELLSGKAVTIPHIKAFGCTIKRERKPS